MTAVQKLDRRLEALPEAEREAIARAWLEELKAQEGNGHYERRSYWITGRKPGAAAVRKNINEFLAFRKEHNITLGGLSIRELIEEGRH